MSICRSVLLFLLVLIGVSANGQRPTVSPTGGQSNRPTVNKDTIPQTQNRDRFFNEVIQEDTLNAAYYNLLLPSFRLPVNDTIIHEYFHQYDWSRTRLNDFAHLGNVGSAAHPIVYEQIKREGFDIGLHQFDTWKYGESDRLFYDLQKSFTHLQYSQGNQQNQIFKATLARAFEDNFSLALDYRRINQLGIYQRQNIDHSNLHIGLSYKHSNNRYSIFASLISNGLEAQENGGITTDTLFGLADFNNAATIPVILDISSVSDNDGAELRHQERKYQLYQSYRLLTDSSDLSKPQITLSNSFTYESNFYKYGDELNNIDTSFYGENLVINPQGLRMYITENVLANHFKIFLANLANPNDPKAKNTHVEAGLKLSSHQLSNEVQDSSLFNLMLTGGGILELNENVTLFTDNHFTIAGDNIGAYKIEGDLIFRTRNLGDFNVQFLNQNYRPTLIHNVAPISNNYLWQNDFSNINELSLNAGYTIQSINTTLGFGYHLLNNFIYFDDQLFPIQKDSEISILQFSASKNFTLGKFHFDNYAVYQTSSSKDLPVPDIFSKHSLYFQGFVFKNKMNLRTGLDVRYVSEFEGYRYMPLIGQFYPNRTNFLESFLQLDFFTSFKVGNMRVFLKMEHLEDLWNVQKEYLVWDHPQNDLGFRFGLSWYLIN